MTRILDKAVTKRINQIKREYHIRLSSVQRSSLRRYLIGYPNARWNRFANYRITPTRRQISQAENDIKRTMYKQHYDIKPAIRGRYHAYFRNGWKQSHRRYLCYLSHLKRNKIQLLYINVTDGNRRSASNVYQCVRHHYDNLSNYRDCIIAFRDLPGRPISWRTIAEIAIYLANFRTEKSFRNFNTHRTSLANELGNFVEHDPYLNKNNRRIRDAISAFYHGVSYGFQFKDLFISSDGSVKMLVMQKVEYDPKPIPCPACLKRKVRSNSCVQMLMQSFECENPSCPARSKSGRGKRYSLLGAERQVMLQRNAKDDRVPDWLYKRFHRDITDASSLTFQNMLRLYTWSGDTVLYVGGNVEHRYRGRLIKCDQLKSSPNKRNSFNHLPIVRLLKSVNHEIEFPKPKYGKIHKIGRAIVINGNSSDLNSYVNKLNLSITSVITSPPYYNARKYSHWSNFVCYLIDMLINMRAVRKALANGGTYIYNVGDIVGQDNVFVRSHMSVQRLTLGFYAILLASIAGFQINGDIIWDKGETQSERNSSPNHFAGYLNPINSYEHCLVLSNGRPRVTYKNTLVKSISPVKKINSKGQNCYGHSAPFPEAIARLIIPYTNNHGSILDPYLGSGTTCIVANKHQLKSVGFELDRKYYRLAIKRLDD